MSEPIERWNLSRSQLAEMVDSLKAEISRLQVAVDTSHGLSVNCQDQVGKLRKERDELTAELNQLKNVDIPEGQGYIEEQDHKIRQLELLAERYRAVLAKCVAHLQGQILAYPQQVKQLDGSIKMELVGTPLKSLLEEARQALET